MFRKLLRSTKDSDCFSAPEEVAVARLAAAHRRLIIDEGRVETQSEAGLSACGAFLEELVQTAQTLRLEKAPRSYRAAFTVNYRALFPDETRSYRVDVLEASAEQYAVIWVNGDKFEFSPEAIRRAEMLQRAWSQLGTLLDRWGQAGERAWPAERPKRAEVKQALHALDYVWASFEQQYIGELIEIEEKARQLVVHAVEQERRLCQLEAQHRGLALEALQELPEYRDQQQRLVGCLSHINSVANHRRKGRDDLAAGVLCSAFATLRRCEAARRAGHRSEAVGAARVLATDVVESFAAVRCYLREVEQCMERVDPHLCNNVGLVERLVDWEESWELGARYVQREGVLNAVCDLVAEVRTAQRLAPALAKMCEECDAELFMVLPRIVWLRFLVKPQQQAEFLRDLLPHRFKAPEQQDDKVSTQQRHCRIDAEVVSFLDRFQQVRKTLVGAQRPGAAGEAAADKAAWEALVRRVVNGVAGGAADAQRDNEGLATPGARAAIDGLVLELERWSIELQRHCPEDWNQCSAILVRCLVGDVSVKERHKEAPFRV